jgi:Arc/MetJ-type ribon-helix-helix transcriptional regulator
MATTKTTVTLPDEQAEEARSLVSAGEADSVSGFVKHAVRAALDDAAGWKQMLQEALRQTGGPLTRQERAWADAILHPEPHKESSKGRTHRAETVNRPVPRKKKAA